METMKRFWLLLCCSGALLCGADLSAVHSVYILPMARGLDQYLANRLTSEHVFQVVTDPKMADAVFTDRIGEAFETQMDGLVPPPAPPPPPEAAKKDSKKEAAPGGVAAMTDTVNKLANPALNSAFGRGKGTVFLVHAKGRQVVWSVYDPPKSSSGNDMDRTASDIVSRLKKDLNPALK
jgi:hypothetical protein